MARHGSPDYGDQGLAKTYNGRDAVLDSVTFSVENREFVTVYGRSGCGKTTLMNIIGGLDRPSSGDVAIDGKSLVSLTEDKLAGLRLEKIGFRVPGLQPPHGPHGQ